jgi:hypothetical protein
VFFSSALFLSSIRYCHSLHRFVIRHIVTISHQLLVSELFITTVGGNVIFTCVGDLTLDLLAIRGRDGKLSTGTDLDALILSGVQNLQDILR